MNEYVVFIHDYPSKNTVAKAIVKSLLIGHNRLLKHVKQTGYP